MKRFDHIQPENLEQASKLLGKSWQEALPYAGGTDLYGMIKHELVSPDKIVNLKALSGLDKIQYSPKSGLKIGALVNISQLTTHDVVKEKYPVLSKAASEVASPQLRNMGTVGGNICQRPRCWYYRGHFDCLRKGGEMCYAVDGENKYHCIIGGGPCYIVHPSDTAVAFLALDALLTVENQKSSKTIPIKDFFILPQTNIRRENILNPGDILTSITVPNPPKNTKSTYIKVKERGAWDFAIVSIAAVIQNSGGMINSGKIAFGGVAPIPWLDEKLSAQLRNLPVSGRNFINIKDNVLTDAYPLEQNAYKHTLAKNLTTQILEILTTI